MERLSLAAIVLQPFMSLVDVINMDVLLISIRVSFNLTILIIINIISILKTNKTEIIQNCL
jgi:hypothetical protein